VQHAEVEAARGRLYTVPEWAFPPNIDLEVIEGDHEVASGVWIIATPGHTPGHQSVLIEGDDATKTIVCCQASWSVANFEDATSATTDGIKLKEPPRWRSCTASTRTASCSATTEPGGQGTPFVEFGYATSAGWEVGQRWVQRALEQPSRDSVVLARAAELPPGRGAVVLFAAWTRASRRSARASGRWLLGRRSARAVRLVVVK
jgi:hypothetical protein